MLSVTITKGVIRQKSLLAGTSKKDSSNLDKSAYKLVQPRQIAYNKMRAWQGAIGVSDFRGIISPAYVVMRLREDGNLPHYFHHLYRTAQFAKEAEALVIWHYFRHVEPPNRALQDDLLASPPSRRASSDRSISGLGEWSTGADDAGEA